MSFDVNPDFYARFMGLYADPLAVKFADFAGVEGGQRAVDVGCGPGALTAELVDRLSPAGVAAIDPSAPFVAAAAERFPDVDVRQGSAEQLPYADDGFDLALAQLVVHFMKDPVAGLAEMGRVVRPGGTVAACVWDHAGGGGPLEEFWQAVRETDPTALDESGLAGVREGHLGELCAAAGLREIESDRLTVSVAFPTVADWWEPFTLGVGPAGAYVAGLDDAGRERLLERCTERLPSAPFTIDASAWTVRART
ncbi:MAG: class I SAM-dependent methyltransferase [Actinomycetota bacterium]|nr:class I SAM-dependent methyltransferase [Actinomycetota bacterium]